MPDAGPGFGLNPDEKTVSGVWHYTRNPAGYFIAV
jgi:hypothetical protein